jgi:hypothetical protein
MPGNRGVVRQAVPHGSQNGGVGPNLRMAGHACISRRHSCIRGRLNRCVTEPAIQSQSCHVMLVAEWYWLLDSPVSVKAVIHSWPRPPPDYAANRQQTRSDQRQLRISVRCRRENRWHFARTNVLGPSLCRSESHEILLGEHASPGRDSLRHT